MKTPKGRDGREKGNMQAWTVEKTCRAIFFVLDSAGVAATQVFLCIMRQLKRCKCL